MKIAILDFDNTLYKGYTRYQTAAELEKMGVVAKGLTKEIDDLQESYESGQISYNKKFADDKEIFARYYAGLKVADLDKFVRTQFDLEAGMFKWSKELVSTLQEAGYLVVLLTGSWDFIIERAQEILEFDSFFATEFAQSEGMITGAFNRIMDFEQKKLISKQLLAEAENSIGIGDSTADFPFLELTDHSFLIEPNADAIEASLIQLTSDVKIIKNNEKLLDEVKKVIAS